MTQKRISNFFSKAPTAKRIREGGATSLDFTSDSSLCAAPPAESRRDEQRQLTQVSEPTTATLTMSHPHPSSPHADSQKADAGAQSFRPPLDYNFPVKKKVGRASHAAVGHPGSESGSGWNIFRTVMASCVGCADRLSKVNCCAQPPTVCF